MVLGLLTGGLVSSCASQYGGFLQTYTLPNVPKAVSNPMKVWQPCGHTQDDWEEKVYCIEEKELSRLRSYVIRMEGVAKKYERQAEIYNRGK